MRSPSRKMMTSPGTVRNVRDATNRSVAAFRIESALLRLADVPSEKVRNQGYSRLPPIKPDCSVECHFQTLLGLAVISVFALWQRRRRVQWLVELRIDQSLINRPAPR